MTILRLLAALVLVSAITGCTIKATLDTATDGTTEFASSTSGKLWWSEYGLVKPGRHAEAFVSINHDNLLQDIAKGEGEYLLALGNILQISAGHQAVFSEQMQQQYLILSNIHVQEGVGPVKQFLQHVGGVTKNLTSDRKTRPSS